MIVEGDGSMATAQARVATTMDPLALSGHAYARDGQAVLAVRINGEAVYYQTWADTGEVNDEWSFPWTPPGEGIYVIQPTMYEWAFPWIPSDGEGHVDEQPGEGGDDLPAQVYLPLVFGKVEFNLYLPYLRTDIEDINGVRGLASTIYVDLTPPTVGFDEMRLTRRHLLGKRAVALTGPAADSVLLQTVEVRIDDGPWDRAGHADGRWWYPWLLDGVSDGETHVISVRAVDVAGRVAEATQEVVVDIAAPQPGPITYAYVNAAGATRVMAPGDYVADAVSLIVTWGEATDGGAVRYQVGFTPLPVALPGELTDYAGPGSHEQPVQPGERRYAILRFIDANDNVQTVETGPFFVGNRE
ncbi:MAG: hypothetical protein R2854_00585 [Caldilineaceae bacterium]